MPFSVFQLGFVALGLWTGVKKYQNHVFYSISQPVSVDEIVCSLLREDRFRSQVGLAKRRPAGHL